MPRRVILFVIFTLAMFLVTACNDKADDKDDTTVNQPSPLQIEVASSSITPDENRVVLAFWDGQNRSADVTEVRVNARLALDDTQTVLWTGSAATYGDYEIPYWVVYPELTEAGAWFFDLEITMTDDKTFNNSVAFNVYETPFGIGIGAAAYPSENRIWDGESDLKLITTASEPNPAFYEKTIATALTEDKPLVIAFTTPGLCTSKLCAPVMRSIDPLWAEYGEQINFVHVEVYEDFETLAWVPTMGEWGLLNEPWVYVIDSAGIVTMRLDGPVAPSELKPYLEAVLADVE